MAVGGSRHVLASLSPEKRSGTHLAGDCVGPIAGLDMTKRIYSENQVASQN